MKKIVFFDIDGTLLDHEKAIPSTTKKAITKLKENGIYVAIATGRAPFMFESIREELGIESYVSYNGQYVVFEKEVIYENPLNQIELERLLAHSSEKKHPLVFMNEKTMKATVNHHRYIDLAIGSLNFALPDYDASFYKNKKIYQTLLFCENEEEYIKNYPLFHFIRWHEYSVDVLPKGGSKAEGIKKMIERLGFDLADVYAFGDGLNDLEMLKAAGTSVAMGNGVPEAKELADYITTDVADDGIWNGLKELQLI